MENLLDLFNYVNFDYFQQYDLFSTGLFGAAYFFVLFFLFVYSSFRGYRKDAFELSINILSPLFLVSFLMILVGFPSRLIGIVVIFGFVVCSKYFVKMKNKQTIILTIKLILILAITSSIGSFFGNLMFYGLIIYNFIVGEIHIRNKPKDKK